MQILFALCILIAVSPLSEAIGSTSETQKRKISGHATKMKGIRVKQAKEIMGKHYKRSVVKVTEKIDAVREYVEQEVKINLPSKSKNLVKKTVDQIMTESHRHQLDPLFILAIIQRESSMNPNAVGGVGEVGLMQIRPETAAWIAKKYRISWTTPLALKDPAMNIKIGAAYIDYLRDSFDRHSRLYISAYNMGPSNVRSALNRSVWPKDYVKSVMEHYVRFYSEIRDQNEGPSKPLRPLKLNPLS
ncbi:MAG: lytic transglycosylase domain-containing protein [Bdellovibrionales bacterium]|nr:lytic transglycosylase domain-containing protein [Bdellovibrionales bacterium]